MRVFKFKLVPSAFAFKDGWFLVHIPSDTDAGGASVMFDGGRVTVNFSRGGAYSGAGGVDYGEGVLAVWIQLRPAAAKRLLSELVENYTEAVLECVF
ncbi:MAG: hypothetical protein ABIK73_06235 [candidate division WOR-3 bacterium]